MKKLFFNLEDENKLRLLAGLSGEKGQREAAVRTYGRRLKEKPDEIYKIYALYDLADEIGDQRYDELFAGRKTENVHIQNWSRSRIKALRELLTANRNYIADRENTELYICSNITVGNIYIRLSHRYLEMFEYETARVCAQKAREHLWDALQAHQMENNMDLYKLLIHLNFAKYYREWAALTRRSNYPLALRELEIVFESLKRIMESSGNKDEKTARQLALVAMDAMLNKGRVFRLDYDLDRASIYLSGIIIGLQQKTEGKKTEMSLPEASETEACDMEQYGKLLENLESSDRREYLMSSYIQLSLVLIKQRKYILAQELLEEAESYDELNRDVQNNLGLCFRKQKKISLAVRKFLGVVRLSRSEKNQNETLTGFLTREVKRIRQENDNHSGIGERNFENWEAEDNRFAYINLLKCILNLYESDKLEHAVFADALYVIDNRLKYYPNDFEVSLLKSRYLMRDNRLEEAVDILKSMTEVEELSYVRRGTIGLKVRYMLSECYLGMFRFSEAEKLLTFIRTELHKDGSGIRENQIDSFVENNIGWCLLQRGRHQEALECYERLMDSLCKMCLEKDTKEVFMDDALVIRQVKTIMGNSMRKFWSQAGEDHKLSEEDKQEIEQWKNSSCLKIPVLNNMGESYLRADSSNEDYQKNAKDIFDLIIRIEPQNGLANLRRGYCEADMEKKGIWFAKAFQLSPDSVEVRSAYLINMVERYGKAKTEAEQATDKMQQEHALEKMESCSAAIKKFIRYLPYTYTINMCLALLDWEKKEDWPEEEREEFYKTFSRIELYSELGTRAFCKLKNESGFHYLKSVQRGKILAHLLYLYEPIVKIRKCCHYQYKDWKELVEQVWIEENGQANKREKRRSGLVHYTGLDTLKALLDPNGTPHLRVSNSGYMNDASEGEIFFEEMRYAVENLSVAEELENLIQCYFHELKGDPNRVLPRGGNVYITSLSTQADSFPMWDIYAGKEQGCNIEFDEDFFDLKGNSWGMLARNDRDTEKREEGLDYSISTYTDDDYPLYKIQYVYRDHYKKKENKANPTEICSRGRSDKMDSVQMDYNFFTERLKEIVCRWYDLHCFVEELWEEYKGEDEDTIKIVKEAINEIRAFVADRMNEVRYLFKDRDYSFEGEVRIVRVVDVNDNRAHTDSRKIPRAFTEVDKEIQDIVVTLASKLSDEQVNEITTWLRHTGKVKDVKIATRNRRRWMIQGSKIDRT